MLQTRTIESTTDPTPQLCIKTLDLSDDFIIPKEKDVACLDADKVIRPLIIRKWQKGDKFVPFGMTGKKNVSDYLTDRYSERKESAAQLSERVNQRSI